MNASDERTHSIEHETGAMIAAMRRELRITRALLAACALCIVVGVFMGQSAPREEPAQTLRGNALELQDPGGSVYIRASVADDQRRAFSLFDANGVERISIAVAADGAPSVVLRDRNKNDMCELAVLDNATPRLVLRDSTGRERLKGILMPDGSPMFYAKDAQGNIRVELASLWTGLHGFIVFNDAGEPLGGLALWPNRSFGVADLAAEGFDRFQEPAESAGDEPVSSGP
jgi:hypothetical protein